jgi:hypothetical protein
MNARIRFLATGLMATSLAGCANGQRLGWTTTRADATDRVRASCEEATRTLKGGPDHATALQACLDAKTRQRVSS